MFVCGGNKNVDYFSSLMIKFVIMKYRHFYKQPLIEWMVIILKSFLVL
jgi:hypothetical protein